MLSTGGNDDEDYEHVGIIHYTAQGAVNVVKGVATDLSNFVGFRGFAGGTIKKVRTEALNALLSKIDNKKQKVCNIKMDIEIQGPLIIVHINGTVYEKQ